MADVTPLETGLQLMAQHETANPAPEPAHAATEVFGGGNSTPFNPVVPE
jgi:hypothetical protein